MSRVVAAKVYPMMSGVPTSAAGSGKGGNAEAPSRPGTTVGGGLAGVAAMAAAAMAPLSAVALPSRGDDWQEWFLGNYRSFRRTLLLHRDGARLHAGSFPSGDDLDRLRHKIAFLTESGLPAKTARLAMLTAGQLSVGSALEEQVAFTSEPAPLVQAIDHAQGFEAGLRLLVGGLAQHRVQPTR